MTYSQNIPASLNKQGPDRSAWWSLTKRGYRLTPAGSAGLSRLGIEQRPGTFVSQKRLVTIRDNWILSRKPTMRSLAERVKESGDLNGWIRAMREEIRDVHRANYILGRGGLKNMAQADWGRLGGTLGQQYNYLNDFATKIATTPDLSADYIAARSQMYMESSGVSFERGKAAGIGVPALPEHPGDGNTQCLTNCKCYWDIRQVGGEWHCYWRLQPAEHCPDCLENTAKWNPLILPVVATASRKDILEFLSHAKFAS